MKKILIAAVVSIIFASCIKENAPGDFEYTEKNKKITITDYTGESKDVIIPKRIKGKLVTILEDESFSFKQLKSVVIPGAVKIIGNYTFTGNQLTNLDIPRSVTYIGKYAFSWNQLTSLDIPDSVEFIGDFAFIGSRLTNITLPANVEIELSAFNNFVFDYYNKNGRRAEKLDITFTASGDYNIAVLNNTFAEILSHNNRDKEVIIPAKINDLPVRTIGYSAFFGRGLTNITIPESVTIIGSWAFGGNSLSAVTIPHSVEIIAESAFQESAITSVNIPDSVTVIGESAFNHNRLTEITIPNSVISIGHFAFTYNQLTSVTIPDSVTDFGIGVFDSEVVVDFENR